MKKNNNSLMATILGGAIFCFVFLGMAFIFTNNTKIMKGNNSLNNEEINVGEEDETTIDHCTSYQIRTEKYCLSGSTHIGEYCFSGSLVYDTSSSCSSNGGYYTNNTCYSTRTNEVVRHTKICNACETGYVPSSDGSVCNATTEATTTCLPGTYYLGQGECGDCTADHWCPGGTFYNRDSSIGGINDCPGDTTSPVKSPSSNSCTLNCPSGYSHDANATTVSECYITVDAGRGVDWLGSSHLSYVCHDGYYFPTSRKVYYGHNSACAKCNEGQVSNADHTGCLTEGEKCYCNPLDNRCEWRSTNANNWIVISNITSQDQCNAYSTNNSTGCFKKTSDNSYVWGEYGNTSGYTAVSGATSQDTCEALNSGDPEGIIYGLSCPTNVLLVGQTIACTYSTTGTATLAGAVSTDSSKATVSTSGIYVNVKGVAVGSVSVYGRTNNNQKTNSVPLVVSNSATPTDCTISVSTGSIATSVDTTNNHNNSYYTVNVTIAGSGCAGQKATYTASNGTPTPSSYSIPANHGTSTITTSFKVYPIEPCSASTATATLTNGKSGSVTISKNDIRTDWKSTSGVCVKNPTYTSFEVADRAGANVYYTNYDASKGCYTVKWTRGGCGSSGGSGSPTLKCYKDENGKYWWVSNPEPSWEVVSGITKEIDCKETEEDACYKDPNGEYQWGKYAKEDGYTLITSINESSLCQTPTEEDACYKKDNDYKWTTSAPEGYIKVDGVENPEDCGEEEIPACYLHNSKYEWGKYDKVKGYIIIEDISTEDECQTPVIDACYVDKNGNYVWGSYGSDEDYTLVPSVTEMNQCKSDVPVPATGISISKLIYILMAIIMACGVGFIYYSSVVKKNN